MNVLSKNRRAPASSPMAIVVATPQAPSSGAGARGQPPRKARRLGSSGVVAHPGSAANVVSTYCARSGAGFGGGQTGQGFSGTCTQPPSTIAATRSQRAMWIVYLEMFAALAVAALIVWFT